MTQGDSPALSVRGSGLLLAAQRLPAMPGAAIQAACRGLSLGMSDQSTGACSGAEAQCRAQDGGASEPFLPEKQTPGGCSPVPLGYSKTPWLPRAICTAEWSQGQGGGDQGTDYGAVSLQQLAVPGRAVLPQPSCAESMAECRSSPHRGEPIGLQLQGGWAQGCAGSGVQGDKSALRGMSCQRDLSVEVSTSIQILLQCKYKIKMLSGAVLSALNVAVLGC